MSITIRCLRHAWPACLLALAPLFAQPARAASEPGDLWEERVLRSVANLTRRDGAEFLALAPRVPVRTEITEYPLERANDALEDLRAGRFRGAAVIVPPGSAA